MTRIIQNPDALGIQYTEKCVFCVFGIQTITVSVFLFPLFQIHNICFRRWKTVNILTRQMMSNRLLKQSTILSILDYKFFSKVKVAQSFFFSILLLFIHSLTFWNRIQNINIYDLCPQPLDKPWSLTDAANTETKKCYSGAEPISVFYKGLLTFIVLLAPFYCNKTTQNNDGWGWVKSEVQTIEIGLPRRRILK